jgi:hypothetical protein
MNKKLFSGLSLMVLAGVAFWACGEGNINKTDELDDKVSYMYPDEKLFKEDLVAKCKLDTLCMAQFGDYVNGEYQPPEPEISSSSEDAMPISHGTVYSSQRELDISGDVPSSSSFVFKEPESSAASSSSAAPVTGLGSCKPEKNPINKGDAVAWTFSPNPTKTVSYGAVAFAQAQYAWDFGGLTDDGSGVTSTSGKVKYAESGEYVASVVVSVKNKDGALETETKECEPLQVNGDPITCTCVAAGGDVTKDNGVATWTASCTTPAPSEINSYTWNGEAGTETFTHTFAKKGEEFKPELKVGNTDKTVITVSSCDAVVATDASIPDYVLDGTAKGTYENLGAGTYQMVYACKTDQYYQTPVLIKSYNSSAVSGTVNGTPFSVQPNNQTEVFKSETPNETIKIEITSGTATATCG